MRILDGSRAPADKMTFCVAVYVLPYTVKTPVAVLSLKMSFATAAFVTVVRFPGPPTSMSAAVIRTPLCAVRGHTDTPIGLPQLVSDWHDDQRR